MRALLFTLIHKLVSAYPRWIVFLSIGMAALAGFYGVATMEMITDQDRLLSENLDYHHRYMEFIRNFGDLEFLYILIEGPTRQEMIDFADALAERLRHSDDIEDVIYAFDTRWAADYALHFDETSLQDIRRLKEELENNLDNIKTLFQTASIDQVLLQIRDAIPTDQQNPTPINQSQMDDLQVLIQTLQGNTASPFKDLYQLENEVQKAKNSAKKYNWSESGGFLLMLVMPAKDFSTLSVIERPLKRIRTDIWLTQQDYPTVLAGLTGRPALQADEMATTNRDMKNASIMALVGVTLLFILFFREIGRPFCGILALLCAMGWTYGFVALTLGHLNLLSLVFALILIGLGIDFGIHFLHRYQEELEQEGDPSLAVAGALHHVGSGILTGATTSSIAFLLALSTDFLGLAELGYVAGVGILFCLLAMLITLPAMLITYDRHFRKSNHLPTPLHLVGLQHVSRWPLGMVLFVSAATVFLLPRIKNVSFNDNLLDLQAEGLSSVEYEHKLMNESEYSTWYCAFLVDDMEGVRNIVSKLKQEPTVAGVDSLADALPYSSLDKRQIIQSISQCLDPLVNEQTHTYKPNPFIYKSLVEKVNFLAVQQKQWEEQIDQLKKLHELKKQIQAQQKKMEERKQKALEDQSNPQNTLPSSSEIDPRLLELAQTQRNESLPIPPDRNARAFGERMPSINLPNDAGVLNSTQTDSLSNHPVPFNMSHGLPAGMELPEGIELPAGFDMTKLDQLPEIPVIPQEVLDQLDRLKELARLLNDAEDVVTARLQKANQQLFQLPRKALRTLKRLVDQEAPSPDALPYLFKRLFIGKDNRLLVMAYPKENIWETQPMQQFVNAMRKIDPHVTGTPIQVHESSLLMRDAFTYIGIASLIAVSVLVLLDFLSLRALFYVILPLMLGVLWLVEIMGTFDVYLNLANFFAIPILIGIGVDNAVHFFHRYEENHDVEKSMYTTGTTLTLTTLTTITGFGSLIFASHKGLASLGLLMVMGSATCWFSCVVFMPTLIKLTCRHHKAKMEIRG